MVSLILSSHLCPQDRSSPQLESVRISAPNRRSHFSGNCSRGRTDVYPVRWENKDGSKSGYTLACGNEWRVGLCDKKRVKCSECGNRLLPPLADRVIYDHLAGEHVVGVYPLLTDDTCHFLAADFDESDWRDDAKAFAVSCHELGVPIAIEISRSGAGAHAWIFFSSAVPARDARRLGSAIISPHLCPNPTTEARIV